MEKQDPINHRPPLGGEPTFCHFLNRELHEALGIPFNAKLYLKLIRLLTTFRVERLYCGLSQLYEAAAGHPELIQEISELSGANIFLAHSLHGTINEFIESRQALYSHDASRYAFYFEAPPPLVSQLQPIPLAIQGTTRFIANHVVNWEPSDPDNTATATMRPADIRALSPIADVLRRITETRTTKAMTASLFHQNKIPELSSATVDRSLRRLLSGLYVRNYRDSLRGEIVWGVPSLIYFDRGEHRAELSYDLMDWFYGASNLSRFFETSKSGLLTERILLHRSPDHLAFTSAYRRLAICVDTFRRRFPSALGPQDEVRRVIDHLERMMPESIRNRPIPETFAEALIHGMLVAHVLVDGLIEQDGEVRRAIEASGTANIRLLLLTATETEDQQLTFVFRRKGLQVVDVIRDGPLSIRYFGASNGVSVFQARSSAGSAGSMGSAPIAQEAIDSIQPDFIISAGICFGMQQEKSSLCDVLVSTRVHLYEPQRVTQPSDLISDERITSRGESLPASPTLLDRIRSLKMTKEYPFKILEGILLSGDKLVDSKPFIEGLKRIEPEAVGGEMEATGISSICQRQKKDWIVVKGICDWGYDKRKDSQATAASNAFAVVADLISTGLLSSQLSQTPNYLRQIQLD